MIKNKYLLTDPNYYIKWDNFVAKFPQEAAFIVGKFNNLCKQKNKLYGKTEIMNILNKLLPMSFPQLKINFEKEFPYEELDAVLGVGLWHCVDSDSGEWFWTDILDQNGNFQTKLYAKN
jgi:hypothetical protein